MGKNHPKFWYQVDRTVQKNGDFSALCKTPVAQKMTTGFGGLANKLSSFARLRDVVGEKV